jgi:hypothetical protein
VTKRLVDIDDKLLEQARHFTGAATIKATVETALRELVQREAALEHIRFLAQPGVLDFDAFEEARAPRFPVEEDEPVARG